MQFVLFLLLILMYLLMGVLTVCLINLAIEDELIKTSFDINKYKIAILVFWPAVPIIIFILGLGQGFSFIKDCISKIRKK
jgi:hypothetical protein